MKIDCLSSKLFKTFAKLYIIFNLPPCIFAGWCYLFNAFLGAVCLLQIFCFLSKNFPFRGECHETTFGTSFTHCLFAAMLLISPPVVFKATGLAYVECHAVCGHSVVLIHRLLDVNLILNFILCFLLVRV